MNFKKKLKIGEFSQLMQVTVKTLRHYEQKGLLVPDEVDEWTGYRYYSIDQMQRLKTIRDLQRLGFSLVSVSRWMRLRTCAIHILTLQPSASLLRK